MLLANSNTYRFGFISLLFLILRHLAALAPFPDDCSSIVTI